MKSIILYTLTTAPVTNPKLYTAVGPVWIRHELFDGDASAALDAADPLPGESVSNSHLLPEPTRYRLLIPGEVIKAGDEEQNPDDIDEWAPQNPHVGSVFKVSSNYAIRRPLKSFEDAY